MVWLFVEIREFGLSDSCFISFICMEFPKEIENWLETISFRRREWFIRYVRQDLFLLFSNDYSKDEFNKILEEKKEQMIRYMDEEDPKDRKHGSKWKNHKERWIEYVKGIKNRFEKYGVDYVRLFKELYNVDLKEKNDGYLWLCPIHKEKNPSLSIHPYKRCVKCYGCGHGWSNIVYFIRNTSDKNVAEIYGEIEKYIFSKEESKVFDEYWKNKKKHKTVKKELNPYWSGNAEKSVNNPDFFQDDNNGSSDFPF